MMSGWRTGVAGKPIRVTSMPRPASPADPGTDIAKLEQQARAETDHGVSDVIWTPDGEHLIFNFHGQLYQVIPGQVPQRLIDSELTQNSASSSPHGNRVAYISGGNLCVMTLDGNNPRRSRSTHPEKMRSASKNSIGRPMADASPSSSPMPAASPRVVFPTISATKQLFLASSDLSPENPRSPAEWVSSPQMVEVCSGPSLAAILSISSSEFPGLPTAKPSWLTKAISTSKTDTCFSWIPKAAMPNCCYVKLTRKMSQRSGGPTGHPTVKAFIFISDRDNDYHVYYEPVAGGDPKPITAGKFAVFSASVSTAANALFVVTNQGKVEERHLFRVPLTGGESQRITDNPGTHSPLASPDGQYFADIFSNDSTPPDLYLIKDSASQIKGRSTEQITHSPCRSSTNITGLRQNTSTSPTSTMALCCTHALLCRLTSIPKRSTRQSSVPSTATPSITNGEDASFIPHGDWTNILRSRDWSS